MNDYILIKTLHELENFVDTNRDIAWMAFDTEFIGERRFYTLLCLIQVATPNGHFLIDTINIKDISPFFTLITNPRILKITHAGENDYRILNNQYGVVPQNLFDTQVAAGFVGHRYPISFRKLLEKELRIRISKGYTVTDWKVRPLKKKQIQYALNDVIYLKKLYDRLWKKITQKNRAAWVESEMAIWENPDYYADDEHSEALNSRLMKQFQQKEQVFLLRLYAWRLAEAKRKNFSKEMILPKKMIGVIAANMRSGKGALSDNRIVSSKLVNRHWATFDKMYQKAPTPAELDLLERIPKRQVLSDAEELSAELLYLLVKKQCMDSDIATELLISKNNLKQLRLEGDFENHKLLKGWRRAFLGDDLVLWLTRDGDLKMHIENGRCVIEKIV